MILEIGVSVLPLNMHVECFCHFESPPATLSLKGIVPVQHVNKYEVPWL